MEFVPTAMTRSRRQRPWVLGLPVFLIAITILQVEGRLLSDGAVGLRSGADQHYDVSGGGAEAAESTGSGSSHSTAVVSTSLSDWLQLHLLMMEAFQKVMVQSFMQELALDGDTSFDSSSRTSATQEELLRNVGCARMHAALLDKHVNEDEFSDAISTYGLGDEYYEDYSGGSVASRGAYTAQERLRGSYFASAADATNRFSAIDGDGAASLDGSKKFVDGVTQGLLIANDISVAWYANFNDEFYGRYEDVYDVYEDLDNDVEEDMDGDGAPDEHVYDYHAYNDYEEAESIADAAVSTIDAADEAEWADYLEQAYEYFMVYVDDAAYGAYSNDVYTDQDVPDAVSMLVDIAELVAWARMGSYSFVTTSDDGSVVVVRSGNMNNMNGAAVLDPTDAALFGVASPDEAIVVDDMSLRWMNPDGSLNWGLLTLSILATCTVAMMVCFVASWMSLWRSMNYCRVYGPCRVGKRAGKCYDDLNDDLAKPLVVGREEVLSAVPVEHAAQYVPPVQVNDSVAKALCK